MIHDPTQGAFARALRRTATPGRALAGLALGVLLLVLAGCGAKTGSLHLPPEDSSVAPRVDWIYYFVYWICLFYLGHITLVMLWFLWKYRRRPGVEPQASPSHNTPLEIAWSLPPCVLVVFFFVYGFQEYVDISTPPADAYKIQCIAKQWDFRFVYPNGGKSKELHVPKGEPVEVVLESEDVIHSFYIPRFRIKQDVVPGRFTEVWFTATTATKPGEHFWLFCAEYCGDSHSFMRSKVIVHENRADFDAWVKALAKPLSGEEVFQMYCASCHLKTEAALVGPGLKGVYGSKRKVLDAETGREIEITADEDYLRESILEPGKKLSRMGREFPNVMDPSFATKLKKSEVDAVIRYLRDELK
ncbi:MAG: cytochrome c oxidase subunit II [Planctomycetota bacterium]|nr:MAG: cytochrome c oxidase subunit II [Planctomycetota bacterium]